MASKHPSTSIALGSAPKRNRKSLTLEQKLEILDRVDKGQKTSVIVSALKMPESTIRTVKQNASKIRAAAKAGTPLQSPMAAYSRPEEMQRMEKMLATWIEQQNKSHIPVSLALIQAKAKSIYESIEAENKKPFSASSGWFAKFRKRFRFQHLKMVSEAEGVSADWQVAEEFPATLKKIIEDGEYSSKQVFNFDETGLYWKKKPYKTYISVEESTTPEFKAAKDRVTLLVGANAEGDCKLKPIVVYEHSENPRALKGSYKNENERVKLPEEAEAAAEAEVPQRALTVANLSECLTHIQQALNIIEENDPNVERSSKVIRGVTDQVACYSLLLKEKQQKAKQPITSFFHRKSLPSATETDTDPDDPDPTTADKTDREEEAGEREAKSELSSD